MKDCENCEHNKYYADTGYECGLDEDEPCPYNDEADVKRDGINIMIDDTPTCCECENCGCELNFPECVSGCFGGNFVVPECGRKVLLTLGLFTIVQLERRVQMLIPAYDFCVPGKECVTTTDDPCEVFKHIKFPTNEFFPPRLEQTDDIGICSCGCG